MPRQLRIIAALAMLLLIGGGGWFLISGRGVNSPDTVPSPLADGVPANREEATSGPLHFEQPEVNIGQAKGEVHHLFRLVNSGAQQVRIASVTASCACILGEPERKVLDPGESTSLRVSISLVGKDVGDHKFVVTVVYEADRSRTVQAVIRVSHTPDVSLSTQSVELIVSDGSSATATIVLTDFREKPLAIKEFQTSSPAVKARVVATPLSYQGGWQYTIEVSFSGELTQDKQEGIAIVTDDPGHPILPITVVLRQFQRLQIFPATIRL